MDGVAGDAADDIQADAHRAVPGGQLVDQRRDVGWRFSSLRST